MLAQFAQFLKCLYCLWPAAVAGVGWWLSRMVEGKTYYGSLTPGVDPVSPQGQAEFETRRERDKEKRHIIYWCVGVIAVGYLGAFLYNTFSVQLKAAAAPLETPTAVSTAATMTRGADLTPTLTPEPPVATPTLGTPVYLPTATDRIIYQIVTVEVPVPVIVTPIP
jgi:hypothetical protein